MAAPTPKAAEPASTAIDWRQFSLDLVQALEACPPALVMLDLGVGLSERYDLVKADLPAAVETPAPTAKAAAPVVESAAPAKPAAPAIRRVGAPIRPAPLVMSAAAMVVDEEPADDEMMPGGFHMSDEVEDDLDPSYRDPTIGEADPMTTLEGEPEITAANAAYDAEPDDGWCNPHRLKTDRPASEASLNRTPVIVPLRRTSEPMTEEEMEAVLNYSAPVSVSNRVAEEIERRTAAKRLTR